MLYLKIAFVRWIGFEKPWYCSFVLKHYQPHKESFNEYLIISKCVSAINDFYMAPDEIRNDREICLKVLLESEEFIWNIPDNVKTLEFYEELFQKGYKNNFLAMC